MDIETNKIRIIDKLQEINRKGINDLIDYLDNKGFFSTPCSTQYHLCYEGGLAEHSLNVFDEMLKIKYILNADIGKDSVILCGILHDVGKIGQFDKPMYRSNILKSGKQSDSKPYITNKELLSVPHEVRSIAILSEFIELTEEEQFAILYHNGMYGDLKYQLNGKETPLQMILHFTDMWCSRVIEK